MRFHLLVETQMLPLPADVRLLDDFGPIMVRNHSTNDAVRGYHMAVEGEESAIKNWLRPFDGVWVGRGSPQAQSFEVMHINS